MSLMTIILVIINLLTSNSKSHLSVWEGVGVKCACGGGGGGGGKFGVPFL